MAKRLHLQFSASQGDDTYNMVDPTHKGEFDGVNSPATRGVGGPDGGYVSFPGGDADEVVQFDAVPGAAIDGEISIGVWFRSDLTFVGTPDPRRQREMLTRRGGKLSCGWEQDNVDYIEWLRVFVKDTNGLSIETDIRDDGEENGAGEKYPTTRDGEWHYLLVRFKPATGPTNGDGEFQVFIDGILRDDEAGHNLVDLDISSSGDWWTVGGRKSGTTGAIDRNAKVDIDEVEVWDHYVKYQDVARQLEAVQSARMGEAAWA